jgi:hypothetical protein
VSAKWSGPLAVVALGVPLTAHARTPSRKPVTFAQRSPLF